MNRWLFEGVSLLWANKTFPKQNPGFSVRYLSLFWVAHMWCMRHNIAIVYHINLHYMKIKWYSVSSCHNHQSTSAFNYSSILVEHGQIMANWQWLQTLHQLRQSQRARTWKPESRNSGPDRNTPKNQWLIIIYPLEDRVITLSKQHVQTHPDGLMYVWNQDPKMISYLVSSGYLMYRWKITHLEMNMTM